MGKGEEISIYRAPTIDSVPWETLHVHRCVDIRVLAGCWNRDAV